jgi:hypothetical protein
MFLSEKYFQFPADIEKLKNKLEKIYEFTSLILLDMSDMEIEIFDNIKKDAIKIESELFNNSDQILTTSESGQYKTKIDLLRNNQEKLIQQWEELGLTTDLFQKMYQCNLTAEKYSETPRGEHGRLLYDILNEQCTLHLLNNVKSRLNPNQFNDFDEYL